LWQTNSPSGIGPMKYSYEIRWAKPNLPLIRNRAYSSVGFLHSQQSYFLAMLTLEKNLATSIFDKVCCLRSPEVQHLMQVSVRPISFVESGKAQWKHSMGSAAPSGSNIGAALLALAVLSDMSGSHALSEGGKLKLSVDVEQVVCAHGSSPPFSLSGCGSGSRSPAVQQRRHVSVRPRSFGPRGLLQCRQTGCGVMVRGFLQFGCIVSRLLVLSDSLDSSRIVRRNRRILA